jgi:hypothetical protein
MMCAPRRRPVLARRLAALALVLGGLGLAGCLVIPVDYHAAGSRHNVNAKTCEGLRPGVTTREEILLTLGEPNFVSEDGQRLGYAWTKVKALWFVGGYGAGAAGEVERSYVLETCFDGSHRVSHVRLLKAWGPAVPPAQELKQVP